MGEKKVTMEVIKRREYKRGERRQIMERQRDRDEGEGERYIMN